MNATNFVNHLATDPPIWSLSKNHWMLWWCYSSYIDIRDWYCIKAMGTFIAWPKHLL